ncbi:hypothetical protein ABEB36_008604 [Hypothenemus hampei]|uniref:Protein phosphatase 1 regulatory subunit 35 C-terminal domain-containing protein n=1 Tax=Hypothenemus hampei TaxID=57062 RepID=A0ABD1EQB2_HYPHA
MDKTKDRSSVRKTLIRNPERSKPKTVVVIPAALASSKVNFHGSTKTDVNDDSMKYEPKERAVTFGVPEMHSTLQLSKKIDEIIKPRKCKSLSDVGKKKLAVDEKVTRKVNFPCDQPVFRNLIPLTNNEIKTLPPSVNLRGPIYQKDKEPILTDFLEPRKQKVIYHKPRIVNMRPIEDKKFSYYNRFKLYAIKCISEETS